MNISQFVGCTMIVVGSTIGAGILAMPMMIAGPGFLLSIIICLISWAVLTISGLLTLETCLALPSHACSFSSMAERTLGVWGKVITWISYLLFLYSVISLYMSGEAPLITDALEPILHIKVPLWISTLLFTFLLGVAIFLGTKVVDYFNRTLISLKGFLLISTLLLILLHVDPSKLLDNQNLARAKYLFAAAPVLLAIFAFHFVIPSLRIYTGDKPKLLKWSIISGTTISLAIYLLWITATLGAVPLTGNNSFTSLGELGRPADANDLMKTITTIIDNKWIAASIKGFFNVSMTTSFLGASLGLFDFLADGFKRPNTSLGRLQTTILTFTPPLIFTFFFPNGFLLALNYAASFIAVLCLILPPLMAYRIHKNPSLKAIHLTFSSPMLYAFIILIGIMLFILPILSNLHLLPSIL